VRLDWGEGRDEVILDADFVLTSVRLLWPVEPMTWQPPCFETRHFRDTIWSHKVAAMIRQTLNG
jgi:hypothetical protein